VKHVFAFYQDLATPYHHYKSAYWMGKISPLQNTHDDATHRGSVNVRPFTYVAIL